jgi:hypothetical protein
MAKNIDVIKAFVNGDSKPKTTNVYIDGDKLFNYNTVLAQRTPKDGGGFKFTLNETNYSRTTSAIQSGLRYEIATYSNDYDRVDGIPMGSHSLEI